MTKSSRPAVVRFYLDADVLGLAKELVRIRGDVTYPGDPGGPVKGRRHRAPCPITATGTLDTEWIPEVTKRQWLIITRDRHILDHRAEIDAVRTSGARMVVLIGEDARDTFHQLEVLMCQWRKIEALLDETGPFIYTATRTTMRSIEI